MYERFTERAVQVMQFAEEEARLLNHAWIGTEHILIGLIREPCGIASSVLKDFNVDLQRTRLAVEAIISNDPEDRKLLHCQLPHTPEAMQVMKNALNHAHLLKHAFVGTEHLLLGLIADTETLASQILLNHGIQLERVRKEVHSILAHSVFVAPTTNQPQGFWEFLFNLFLRQLKPHNP